MSNLTEYTDPRARRLIVSAYWALGATAPFVAFLTIFLAFSGGEMITASWVLVSIVAVLALAAVTNLALAPRAEAEAARLRALPEPTTVIEVVDTPPAPPTAPVPTTVPVTPTPVAPAPAIVPAPEPVPTLPAAPPEPAVITPTPAPAPAAAP